MIRAMLVKEFKLVFRDKYALAALFLLPCVFIVIMSTALQDSFDSEKVLLNYTLIDMDNSKPSRQFSAYLQESPSMHKKNIEIINDDHKKSLLQNDISFVLTIPAGFSHMSLDQNHTDSFLEILLAADIRPDMLVLIKSQIASAITRLRIEKMRSNLIVYLPALDSKFDMMKVYPDKILKIQYSSENLVKTPTSTQQSVPSWIIFGMFFIIIPMSTIFINERKQNTLMRMSVMNIGIPTLFMGKIAPYMLINQIQVWLMILVGIYIVPLAGAPALTPGNSKAGIFLISFAIGLSAIGTSVLIAVLVSTVEQATTIGGIFNILLGAIGGIMVPKFLMPPIMQELALISPMSWGLEGFLDLFLRGEGVEAVLTESLTLVLFGSILLMLACVIFQYRSRRSI